MGKKPAVKPTSKATKLRAEPTSGRNHFKHLAYLFSALILALLLFVGHFDIGGGLPRLVSDLATAVFGLLGWTILPALIVYLAIYKFRSPDRQLPTARWLPASLLLLCLAGMLHVFIAEAQALEVVREARYGGGYVGYGIVYLLKYTHILTAWLAFIILLAVSLVAICALFDISLGSLGKWFGQLWRRWRKTPETAVSQPDEEVKKPAKVAPLKLKEGVPLEKAGRQTTKTTGAKDLKDELLKAPVDPNWRFPPLNLLIQKQDKADAGDIQANAEIIRETLANFNIDVEMEGANIGPRVTQYTLRPPSGIKLSRILGLESNIALDLAASSIRIEAPIPGQRAVGIEVPNRKPATVRLSSLMSSKDWQAVKPGSSSFLHWQRHCWQN